MKCDLSLGCMEWLPHQRLLTAKALLAAHHVSQLKPGSEVQFSQVAWQTAPAPGLLARPQEIVAWMIGMKSRVCALREADLSSGELGHARELPCFDSGSIGI